jgi:hypothetical protein
VLKWLLDIPNSVQSVSQLLGTHFGKSSTG